MGIGVLLQDAIGSWDPLDFVGYQSGEALLEHTELSDEEIADRVLDSLGEVRLDKRRFFSAFSHEISRGQAQRAMLASALLSGPRLLIADEPLSGLDVTTARSVMSLIEDMRNRRGMGMLLVTHDLAVVAATADRVAVVYGGAIVEMASVEDLFRSPQHPYTSGLLGSVPGFTPSRLRPIEGELPDIWNLPRGCPFNPRCPYAEDVCRTEVPKLEQVGRSMVACHRAWALELPGIAG
jgi:oligopeptide/dipeptide ABC transporter ATP-binding protein